MAIESSLPVWPRVGWLIAGPLPCRPPLVEEVTMVQGGCCGEVGHGGMMGAVGVVMVLWVDCRRRLAVGWRGGKWGGIDGAGGVVDWKLASSRPFSSG